MTMHDEIEARLLRALAFTPSADGLRWLDQRVAETMARPVAMRRRHAPGLRTLLRPLALAAAFVVLTGAVVGGVGLIERMLESAPGWRTAYDNAEVFDLQATDAGYTLKLERAYADLNQVVVFITVEGLAAPRSTDGVQIDHFNVYEAILRDPEGQRPDVATAITGVEPGLGAAVESFHFETPTAAAGTYQLTITSIGYGADGPDCLKPCVNDHIAGSWPFEFELPEAPGTVVSADVSDTVGTASLHLTELRVTPTMISARIALFVDDKPVAYWMGPYPTIRHNGTSYEINASQHVLIADPEKGPEMVFSSRGGTDEAAGDWEIEIPELDYGMTNAEQTHLGGPWKLRVTVP